MVKEILILQLLIMVLFPIIANITVTPSSNENGITCSGPSQLF